jgi:chromate transporter
MNELQVRESYARIFLRFLRFGLLAWGGPIAQIAMIRQELVEEEKWVTKERFNRVLGIYQALPGPEAHELCVYFGTVARGRFGGFLAGLGFMLPGFLFMFALSWFYLSYGMSLPFSGAIFHGFQAAVGALIVRAIHRIGSHSLTDANLWLIAVVSATAELLGAPFLVTLPVLGTACLLVRRGKWIPAYSVGLLFMAGVFLAWFYLDLQSAKDALTVKNFTIKAASLTELFISGLRSGLFTFGGAYTVIAFLQHDAVNVHAWMTNEQFLDGLALSGILPAPLIIFATFVGFLAGGSLGAVVMTVGIFLPAFLFTMVGHHYFERVIESERAHAFLDGVTAAVVGLMGVTTVKLLRTGIDDWPSVAIFSLVLLVLYTWSSRLAIPAVMLTAAAIGILVFG